MSGQSDADRVWDIIEKVGVCMLTTHSSGGLRARPLEARPDRKAGIICFVTDLYSGKEREIEIEQDVGLTFIDPGDRAYLSLPARAHLALDRALAARIWRGTDNAWWTGPDDPNVCVLKVEPLTAELWDGPASKAATMFELVKARLTEAAPEVGENRKITVDMQH